MKIDLPSKNSCEVNRAGFEISCDLADAVMSVIKDPSRFSVAIDMSMSILVNPAVKAAVLRAMPFCVYKDAKLTPDLFDAPNFTDDLRTDYYAICDAIVKVNFEPFLKGAFSASKDSQAMTDAAPV